MGGGLTLHTIGHSNRAIEVFVALLREAGMARVFDVRAHPVSRRHPHFSRAPLEAALARAGIAYAWEGKALGGFRESEAGSPHTALAGAFRGFADHMASDAFVGAMDDLLACAHQAPTVIMCAERLPCDCHRSLITDWLLSRGAEVVHLINRNACERAVPSPLARVVDGRVVYDAGRQGSLL